MGKMLLSKSSQSPVWMTLGLWDFGYGVLRTVVLQASGELGEGKLKVWEKNLKFWFVAGAREVRQKSKRGESGHAVQTRREILFR